MVTALESEGVSRMVRPRGPDGRARGSRRRRRAGRHRSGPSPPGSTSCALHPSSPSSHHHDPGGGSRSGSHPRVCATADELGAGDAAKRRSAHPRTRPLAGPVASPPESEGTRVVELGRVGVWSTQSGGPTVPRWRPSSRRSGTALWIPGGVGEDVFPVVRLCWRPRTRSGRRACPPIYLHDPVTVSRGARAVDEHPGRFLLGLGVSHAPLVESRSERKWERPMATMTAFLDTLAAEGVHRPGRSSSSRVHACSSGSPRTARPARIPTSSPPTTRGTRVELLGPEPLLASTPSCSRPMPSRPGPGPSDAGDLPGSAELHGQPPPVRLRRRRLRRRRLDRLVDALYPWGDEHRIAEVVDATWLPAPTTCASRSSAARHRSPSGGRSKRPGRPLVAR